MADYAGEFTPELNNAVIEQLKKKILEKQAQDIASAQGMALTRGLAGSGYEGNRTGQAVRAGTDSLATALTNLAVENATRLREERLIGEQRKYEAEQASIQREYEALEGAKARAWQTGESEKLRAAEERQGELNRRYELLGAGVGGVAQLGGNLLAMKGMAGLFGGGAGGAGGGVASSVVGSPLSILGSGGSAVTGFGGAATQGTGLAGGFMTPGGIGGVGSTLGGTPAAGGGLFGGAGSFMAPAAGIAAGLGAGIYGGQKLGNSIFKSKAAEKRARTGATIGAGTGTAIGTLFGPLGSAAGGVIGGTIGQGIGGLTKSHAAGQISQQWKNLTSQPVKTIANAPKNVTKSVAKAVSKAFCFDPWTEVVMADGTTKSIREMHLGDVVKDGGTVESIRWSKTADGTMYDYLGVLVTGSHAVLENGKWIRVADSKWAHRIETGGVVVSLVNEGHRIIVKSNVGEIVTADEHETDDYEYLDIDESLARLNEDLDVEVQVNA